MSAFAGLWHCDGRPAERHELERAERALPAFDGGRASIWTGGSAGLVHRLYVITPEDRLERQPWVSRDGARHLVFAGRLDNREELAARLGLPPETLRAMADGELCLTALEHWGDDAPLHLFGSFAFACWHERERHLLLCRDRTGSRALYFHCDAGFIAFATTINALLAFTQVPREMDERSLGDLLANNVFETRRTIYRGIDRVAVGERVLCGRDALKIERYWRPQRRALGLNSHADYVEAAREQLDRAVARALRSVKPIAAHASGGLDSSGVAATAARQLAPERLAVYTRVPPPGFDWPETDRKYFSERPKVMALAALHPNMDVTFVDDAELHAFDTDPARLFARFGFPVLTSHNLGWFSQLNDRVAANGHRVLLTGQSGNFSLGWRGRNLLDQLVSQKRWKDTLKEILALRRVTGQSLVMSLRHFILGPREPRLLRQMRRAWQGIGAGHERYNFVNADFAREHRVAERIEQTGGWSDAVRWGDPFDARARWLIDSAEAARDFRAQVLANYGFEIRDPLADPRLIEFCLNVPEEHYLRDGRPRALERDVIADRVPAEIVGNYKHGEQTPEWFARFAPRRDAISAEIDSIAASPLAARVIAIDDLREASRHWPADAQAANAAGPKFRYGIARAVQLGNFIRWFEGGNR